MLNIVLILIGFAAAIVYLNLVRKESYERGYMMGHAEAARQLREAMSRSNPPF